MKPIFIPLLLLGCRSQSSEASYLIPKPTEPPFKLIRLPVGKHPIMPLIVDVDRDASLDLVVANSESANVSVYLGDGKGAFKQAQGSPFPAGQECSDVAAGDFNDDGNPDLVIANHGIKTVTALLGNGKGQFSLAAGSPFSVDSNPHPHGIAVAHFDGDRNADIAIDSWAENKVLVLFGKGDGTFRSPGAKFEVGKMPYQRLRTADVNADGNADLVTCNFEARSVSVLLGDGEGGFTRKDFSVPPAPFGVAIEDFNGDHHLDIAIEHYSGHAVDRSKNGMSVLFGDGKGNFTLAKGSPFPVGQYPATVAGGDLNGDRIADIVVPNYEDGTLTVYLGSRSVIGLAPYSPIRVGRTPQGIAIEDLNRDGRGDIVVAEDEDNDVLVLLSK
jgi:FG-GAP-like repeat